MVFTVLLVCFGGFPVWARCLAGTMLGLIFLYRSLESKKKNNYPVPVTPAVLLVLSILPVIWALDRTRAAEGVITAFVLFGWFMLAGSRSEDDRLRLLQTVPLCGAAVTAVSVLSLVSEQTSGYFWMADRMGGIFQYSNTCALFLLAGVVTEADMQDKRKDAPLRSRIAGWVIIAADLAGILLTGSRSVELMLIAWAVYRFVKIKSSRIPVAAAAGVMAAAVAAAAVFSDSRQNVARLLTLAASNSTLWGRLLYDIDGLNILLHHPFGLGYMGYYYIQGSVQTGVYTTMYVHNDLLQLGLDCGIVPMLLAAVFFFCQMAKGRQTKLQKILLLLIGAGSLMDFHLQYPVMACLFILCLDPACEPGFMRALKPGTVSEKKKESGAKPETLGRKKKAAGVKTGAAAKKSNTGGTAAIVLSFLGVLVMVYLTIGYGLLGSKNFEAALRVLPCNTAALEGELAEASTPEEAEELAGKILRINPYSVTAYRYRAYAEAMDGNADAARDDIESAVSLDRLNADLYAEFDALLADMGGSGGDAQDSEREQLRQELKSMEYIVNPIAYRLKDQPIFEY